MISALNSFVRQTASISLTVFNELKEEIKQLKKRRIYESRNIEVSVNESNSSSSKSNSRLIANEIRNEEEDEEEKQESLPLNQIESKYLLPFSLSSHSKKKPPVKKQPDFKRSYGGT